MNKVYDTPQPRHPAGTGTRQTDLQRPAGIRCRDNPTRVFAVVNFYLLVYFPLYYALWTFLESLVGGLTFLRG